MKLLTLILTFFIFSAHAQINTLQSSSNLNWKQLENDYVKIYYPDFLEEKAQYIAHLIDHYQKVVGLTYKLKEFEKFPLILRAEMSEPNGFVTLMPRRSEWFSAANITPFIGGLEWYQALAVHEYRHVIQFDYMFQGYNKSFYYVFGELGRAVGTILTADPWFFEGDAVWTETKYSDAGRGRSPRFSARLRALVDADYFPSFDNYLLNDFEVPLPNLYVYGYFNVARGYKKYGEDIWRKVVARSANTFPTPYSFYSAFKKETKENFDDFFQDTLKGLQEKKEKVPFKELIKYREYAWPMVDGFFSYVLKRDLDSFWTLYEVSGDKPKKIKELNINPGLSIPDLKRGYMVYTQTLPDRRYNYKGYSDIYLLSAYSKINTRVTFENRYYHPKLHPKKNEIYALHFDEKNNWSVESVDFNGKILKRLVIPNLLITEFEFIDENTLAVISQDKLGLKTLYQVDLKSKKLIPLSQKTRNNIFALHYDSGSLYFEADYKGKVETIALNLKNNSLSLCSQARYAQHHPFIEKGMRYYTAVDAKGSIYKKEKLQCRKISKNSLHDMSLYVSNGASDNYIQSKPVKMKDYKSLTSKEIKSDEYKKSSDLFHFHSWSFIGGRGFQLQTNSNNYLNDLAANVAVGLDAEEDRPFASLSFQYLKYYPVFSLNIDYAKRNIEYSSGDNDEFTETQGTLAMTLPYYWRDNLFQGLTSLTLAGGAIKVSERERNKIYEASDDTLNTTSAQFTYTNVKDVRYRELLPSAGFTYSILTQKVTSTEDEEFSNFLTSQKASIFSDGFSKNHSLKLTFEEERQKESTNSYRISSPSSEVNQYVFSRGYDYEYTPHFFKGTFNYSMPLKYMRWQYKDYLLVNRIYTNLFFDYTNIEVQDYDRTLNSYGTEIFFDTLTLRKLPLTWGLRFSQNMRDEKGIGEIFVGLGLEI